MSTTEHTNETEGRESGLLVREFQATSVEVEGRTVDVRVVPFGEVADVADPPDYRPYKEQWMPGAFDHQVNAANRIHAKYGHSESIHNVVGHGLSLRSEEDGYHASFKIHATPGGDTALELLNDGALPSVSLEAVPVRSVRTAEGVVQRIKANLRGLAFCREGAFAGAQVLAIREAQVLDQELLPVELDPELVKRLRAQGVHLPSRYEAHPAEDTPPEGGTPETAPAESEDTNT